MRAVIKDIDGDSLIVTSTDTHLYVSTYDRFGSALVALDLAGAEVLADVLIDFLRKQAAK